MVALTEWSMTLNTCTTSLVSTKSIIDGLSVYFDSVLVPIGADKDHNCR